MVHLPVPVNVVAVSESQDLHAAYGEIKGNNRTKIVSLTEWLTEYPSLQKCRPPPPPIRLKVNILEYQDNTSIRCADWPYIEWNGHHCVKDDDVGPEGQETGQVGVSAVLPREEGYKRSALLMLPNRVPDSQSGAHNPQEAENLEDRSKLLLSPPETFNTCINRSICLFSDPNAVSKITHKQNQDVHQVIDARTLEYRFPRVLHQLGVRTWWGSENTITNRSKVRVHLQESVYLWFPVEVYTAKSTTSVHYIKF